MKNFLSLDNPLMGFLSKLADLVILNLLFVVCSLPLITVGASATALCYTTLKLRDGDEGGIFKYFFKSFRQNFLQATLIWVVLAASFGILWIDFNLLRGVEGIGYQIIQIILPVCAILWAMLILYVFFLQARFQNTVPQTLLNALTLSLGNAPRSLSAVAILAAAWLATTLTVDTFRYGTFVWLTVGFSGLARLNCRLLCGKIEGLGPI